MRDVPVYLQPITASFTYLSTFLAPVNGVNGQGKGLETKNNLSLELNWSLKGLIYLNEVLS